jgi:hypothetical protein
MPLAIAPTIAAPTETYVTPAPSTTGFTTQGSNVYYATPTQSVNLSIKNITATGLTPNTSYNVLINGANTQTVGTDASGGLQGNGWFSYQVPTSGTLTLTPANGRQGISFSQQYTNLPYAQTLTSPLQVGIVDASGNYAQLPQYAGWQGAGYYQKTGQSGANTGMELITNPNVYANYLKGVQTAGGQASITFLTTNPQVVENLATSQAQEATASYVAAHPVPTTPQANQLTVSASDVTSGKINLNDASPATKATANVTYTDAAGNITYYYSPSVTPTQIFDSLGGAKATTLPTGGTQITLPTGYSEKATVTSTPTGTTTTTMIVDANGNPVANADYAYQQANIKAGLATTYTYNGQTYYYPYPQSNLLTVNNQNLPNPSGIKQDATGYYTTITNPSDSTQSLQFYGTPIASAQGISLDIANGTPSTNNPNYVYYNGYIVPAYQNAGTYNVSQTTGAGLTPKIQQVNVTSPEQYYNLLITNAGKAMIAPAPQSTQSISFTDLNGQSVPLTLNYDPTSNSYLFNGQLSTQFMSNGATYKATIDPTTNQISIGLDTSVPSNLVYAANQAAMQGQDLYAASTAFQSGTATPAQINSLVQAGVVQPPLSETMPNQGKLVENPTENYAMEPQINIGQTPPTNVPQMPLSATIPEALPVAALMPPAELASTPSQPVSSSASQPSPQQAVSSTPPVSQLPSVLQSQTTQPSSPQATPLLHIASTSSVPSYLQPFYDLYNYGAKTINNFALNNAAASQILPQTLAGQDINFLSKQIPYVLENFPEQVAKLPQNAANAISDANYLVKQGAAPWYLPDVLIAMMAAPLATSGAGGTLLAGAATPLKLVPLIGGSAAAQTGIGALMGQTSPQQLIQNALIGGLTGATVAPLIISVPLKTLISSNLAQTGLSPLVQQALAKLPQESANMASWFLTNTLYNAAAQGRVATPQELETATGLGALVGTAFAGAPLVGQAVGSLLPEAAQSGVARLATQTGLLAGAGAGINALTGSPLPSWEVATIFAATPLAIEMVGNTAGIANAYIDQAVTNQIAGKELNMEVSPVDVKWTSPEGNVYADMPTYQYLRSQMPLNDLLSLKPSELESLANSNPDVINAARLKLYQTLSEPNAEGGIVRPVSEINPEIQAGAGAAQGGTAIHITGTPDIYKALQNEGVVPIEKVGAGAAGYREGFDQGFFTAPSKVIYDAEGTPIRVERAYNFASAFGQPPEEQLSGSKAATGNTYYGIKVNYAPDQILLIDDYAKLTGTTDELTNLRADPSGLKPEAETYYRGYNDYAASQAKVINSPASAFLGQSETELVIPERGALEQVPNSNTKLYTISPNQGQFKDVPLLQNLFPTTALGYYTEATPVPVLKTTEEVAASPEETTPTTLQQPSEVSTQPSVMSSTNALISQIMNDPTLIQNPQVQSAVSNLLQSSNLQSQLQNVANMQYLSQVYGVNAPYSNALMPPEQVATSMLSNTQGLANASKSLAPILQPSVTPQTLQSLLQQIQMQPSPESLAAYNQLYNLSVPQSYFVQPSSPESTPSSRTMSMSSTAAPSEISSLASANPSMGSYSSAYSPLSSMAGYLSPSQISSIIQYLYSSGSISPYDYAMSQQSSVGYPYQYPSYPSSSPYYNYPYQYPYPSNKAKPFLYPNNRVPLQKQLSAKSLRPSYDKTYNPSLISLLSNIKATPEQYKKGNILEGIEIRPQIQTA